MNTLRQRLTRLVWSEPGRQVKEKPLHTETKPIVADERQPVHDLLNPEPAQNCVLCHRSRPVGSIQTDYRTGYLVCWDTRDCRQYRNGETSNALAASEARAAAARQMQPPAVVPIRPNAVLCDCCGRRFGDGLNMVRIAGGRIMCATHSLCHPRCSDRNGGAA